MSMVRFSLRSVLSSESFSLVSDGQGNSQSLQSLITACDDDEEDSYSC